MTTRTLRTLIIVGLLVVSLVIPSTSAGTLAKPMQLDTQDEPPPPPVLQEYTPDLTSSTQAPSGVLPPSNGTAPVLETVPDVELSPASLSGSQVAFAPSAGGKTCYAPGSAQTFCFQADSSTTDYEYVYNLWLKFPTNWTISNVTVQGTPSCTSSSGSFGTFSWSYQTNPYEINISHPRYQASNDSCTATYCVQAVPGTGTGNKLVSWYWDGDNYGNVPHHPCSSDGYTPAGQPACDQSINPPAEISRCELRLTPASATILGCAGASNHQYFELYNNTGSSGTFNLGYNLPGGGGTLTGPGSLTVANGGTKSFMAAFSPNSCSAAGTLLTGVITASGNTYSDTSTLEQTVTTGLDWDVITREPENGRMDAVLGTWGNQIWSITGYDADTNVRTYDPATNAWTDVGSPPPFGQNYARSGCQVGDTVYIYGDTDTTGFTGLWSYKMSTKTWTQLSPTGTPPPTTGIWAPAWARDPDVGICYLTGGATGPGAGDLATAYAYDATSNAWLPALPPFTTPRDFHAAFVFYRPADGHKQLCVAGGNYANVGLASTQCFDFATDVWSPENAILGPLPASLWGMGYTARMGGHSQELWVLGGVDQTGATTDQTLYFDISTGAWKDGGKLESGPFYRGAAVALNNNIYKISGAHSGFSTNGASERVIRCPSCGAQAQVIPGSLTPSQLPERSTQQPLTINNLGTIDLEWQILEAGGATSPALAPPRANPPQAGADIAPFSGPPLQPQAFGLELFRRDAESATADGQLLGVEFANGYYWVTGGNDSAEPNKLYKLDSTGALVATYDQASELGWGWRDLASDGTYLYASDSNLVEQINPATGLATGLTIPCPTNPCRALAYDPSTDHFWTANFDSNLYEINRAGAIVHSFPPVDLSTYGMAWDAVSPGGPFLWLWSQDGGDAGTVLATQVDPYTGMPTGLSFLGSNLGLDNMAGGATISTQVVPGTLALVTMHQATSDTIVAYDLGVYPSCLPVDIPWLNVSTLYGTILPGGNASPQVTFDSHGLAPGSYNSHLCLLTNDMDTPMVSVPVALTVTPYKVYLPTTVR